MANDQRTHNPCIVKESEQLKQEKTQHPGEKQAENKQGAAAESSGKRSVETRGENQSAFGNGSDEHQARSSVQASEEKAVSMVEELYDLEYGMCALKRLTTLAESGYGDDGADIYREISAILTLIICRMVVVRLMVEGKVDPEYVWTAWNDAGPNYREKAAGSDVVFEEWTSNQKLIHARFLLDRAERRVAEELAKQSQTAK